MEFTPFPKLPRLSRDIVITEKLDGTNASIFIQPLDDPGAGKLAIWNDEPYLVRAGSRTRWITPEDDNFGFARWVYEHADDLVQLGEGHHFGEWWGKGIQRGYGVADKRFSLFNTARWNADNTPWCVDVVPKIYSGNFCDAAITTSLYRLRARGSIAAPGFMEPEGIVIYHTAANIAFKKTLEKDHQPKSKQP